MDAEGILRELVASGVDFVVIGGVAAYLHGAPVPTVDLDVVHSRSPENRRRLARALGGLEACYREHLPSRIAPSAEDLASPLVHLLETRLGRLDLLGTVHGGLEYEDLLPRTSIVRLDENCALRILDLRGLIEMKEELGRDKDKEHLRHLRQVLEQRKRQDPPQKR